MENLFVEIFEILVRIIVAVFISLTIVRLSPWLFKINLVDETKNKNKAAAIVWVGVFVMIALIVGLFKI